jgi:hypothetical protein
VQPTVSSVLTVDFYQFIRPNPLYVVSYDWSSRRVGEELLRLGMVVSRGKNLFVGGSTSRAQSAD